MPAATSGMRDSTVFHTCPRVSKTFSRPAANRVKNPSPANDTDVNFEQGMTTRRMATRERAVAIFEESGSRAHGRIGESENSRIGSRDQWLTSIDEISC
jgi:hypothetical protein